jgi:hypothetical protein
VSEALAAAAAATVHDRLAWHADERPGETPEQRAERRRAVAEQARRIAQESAMRVAIRDRAERGIPEPPPPETPEQALDRLASAMRAAPLTALSSNFMDFPFAFRKHSPAQGASSQIVHQDAR